jgi:hypothetical protein
MYFNVEDDLTQKAAYSKLTCEMSGTQQMSFFPKKKVGKGIEFTKITF